MYSAYVEATEQLALEKDKNRLQTQYLDQILKEIEEKAPLLQQQRADYENALLNQVLIWTRDLSVVSAWQAGNSYHIHEPWNVTYKKDEHSRLIGSL